MSARRLLTIALLGFGSRSAAHFMKDRCDVPERSRRAPASFSRHLSNEAWCLKNHFCYRPATREPNTPSCYTPDKDLPDLCDYAPALRWDAYPTDPTAPRDGESIRLWCIRAEYCFDSNVDPPTPWCYHRVDGAYARYAITTAIIALLVAGFLGTFGVPQRQAQQQTGAPAAAAVAPAAPLPTEARRAQRRAVATQDAMAEVLGAWAARPDGSGILPAYLPALQQCCLVPAVLRSSPMRERLRILDAWQAAHPGEAAGSPEQAVVDAARCARDAELAPAALQFIRVCSSWEAAYVAAALRFAMRSLEGEGHSSSSSSSQDACLAALTWMQSGVGFCRSRVRVVFQSVIGVCTAHVPEAALSPAPPLWAPPEAAAYVSSAASAAAPDGDALRAAKLRLFELCSAVAQDLKDAAFRAAFVEPALWYARIVGDSVLEGDVDTHGASVHAALLDAAIGVRTSRLPELDDGVIGVVDFRAAAAARHDGRYAAGLAALGSPQYLGRSWEAVPECTRGAPASYAPDVLQRQADVFIFNRRREECSVGALADRAVELQQQEEGRLRSVGGAEALSGRQAAYARYLRAFTALLAPQIVLPRLLSALEGVSVAGSARAPGGLMPELQVRVAGASLLDLVGRAAFS
jgi:hypothetical protein